MWAVVGFILSNRKAWAKQTPRIDGGGVYLPCKLRKLGPDCQWVSAFLHFYFVENIFGDFRQCFGGFAVWPFELQSLLFLRRCILNSLISERSSANLFLWTNYLFGVLNEMCSSSALSAGNCYFGLRRGIGSWLPLCFAFWMPSPLTKTI